MPRITMAAQVAALTEQVATLTTLLAAKATPVTPSEASQHWREADITCPAKPACAKTFRTAKGAAWHAENVKHGK